MRGYLEGVGRDYFLFASCSTPQEYVELLPPLNRILVLEDQTSEFCVIYLSQILRKVGSEEVVSGGRLYLRGECAVSRKQCDVSGIALVLFRSS